MSVLLFTILFALSCSADHLVFISGYDDNVTSWTLTDDASTFTPVSVSNAFTNPSWMAFTDDRKFVYGVNEIDNVLGGGGVAAFAVDEKEGKFSFINAEKSGGGFPCFISVHKNGNFVFVANYEDGVISVLPVKKSDGSVGPSTYSKSHGIQAHMMISDSSGKFVFAVFKGSDYIAQFLLDENSGILHANPSAPYARFPTGSGPRHIAFHPTEKFAFVISELSSQIFTLSFSRSSGTLSVISSVSSLPPNFNGSNTGAEILLSPNGEFLYASNRGHDSIAIFKVDSSSGRLSAIGWETAGGRIPIPRGVAIDKKGTIMIVASQTGNTVTSFLINSSSGTLTPVSTIPVTKQPSFIQIFN